MLDLQFIREHPEEVKRNARRKHVDVDIDRLLELDQHRRRAITESQHLKEQRNRVSKEIAQRKKSGEDATELIAEMQTVARRIKELDTTIRELEEQIEAILLRIPNMLHESVPDGEDAADNVVVRTWGEPATDEWRKPHWELMTRLELADFERGAKISGSGFPLYVGKGAQLERALINFMLDLHTRQHGYEELFPPFLVNTASMIGTGQLPKFEEDMYRCRDDELYLIPTAEVPLTNIHRDEILTSAELPKKICGYSACFRREAGSYGVETRGLLRLHQFNKVELVKFTRPEESYEELESLVRDAEEVLQLLGLPYRVVLLCAGDSTFATAKTYDIEVWAPGVQRWLEVSSCSNFEDFQARRANIRYRPQPHQKPQFVHTLNGSGVATPRLMAALLEHYQLPDGHIEIPEVLHQYLPFDRI